MFGPPQTLAAGGKVLVPIGSAPDRDDYYLGTGSRTAKIVERMVVYADQAWSVAGPTNPLSSPTSGVDPLADAMKASIWQPTIAAQIGLVNYFNENTT